MTLAVLAVAMKVALPPGLMISNEAGHTASLVICTGHGPLTIPEPGAPQAPVKKASDTSCPFAGTSAPALIAPSIGAAEPIIVAAAAVAELFSADLIPGRGLAAPPPPSHAPPARSI